MKKQLFVFLMMALYSPQVFADGSVSRILPSSVSTSSTTNSQGVLQRSGGISDTSRGNAAAAARAVARTTTTDAPGTADATSVVRSGARVINVNDTKKPTTASDTPRTIRTTGTYSSRSRATGAQSTTSARDNLTAATETVGRNARVSAASINNNPIVRRAGVTLRPTTAEVGGRATIGDTNIQTGSNIGNEVRALQSRAATTATRETIAEAKERLEQTADLNKSCQEQYNDCMDQFCAVIDANQKRCSCSANLSRYTKVEDAVKDANTQLNDVAQRIRYVGLSADEIRAIMSATEAEEALSGKTDTTETRNMLNKIEDMIKDPKSTSSYLADNSIGLDMDLDFSSDTADLFNLDFLNTGTTSFSNLRGTELYNAAKKRCNTVLNQCKNAGGTAQQITGNYDLAIDKDCIAYEQGLTKMNDTLKSNVRSANLMLQKARLAVLQNKNQYDAKGCIAALDTCMKDDMVCGEDYTKCLDPTKRYIDENGNVVLGQNVTDILAFMAQYNNAITANTLKAAMSTNIDVTQCKAQTGVHVEVTSSPSYSAPNITDGNVTNTEQDLEVSGPNITGGASSVTGTGGTGACNVKYLMQKIGTGAKATDNGLCRPVLDKCQYYTYNSNGQYNPYNDIVVNYIQRAMVNISAAQHKIISDYASNCMVDIASCYNQQVTQVNSWSSNASVTSIYKVMSGACYNVALTCAYAVFQHDKDSCPTTGVNAKDTCIQSISEMFYQSLLCPENSTFVPGKKNTPSGNYCTSAAAENETQAKNCFVNTQCRCNDGYETFGNQCLIACPSGQERDTYGTCVTKAKTPE